MKLIADENVHGQIVRWLRRHRQDVLWAAEILTAVPDSELLALSRAQERILLTADKDFGELVFLRGLPSAGVILLRLERLTIAERVRLLAQRWVFIEHKAPGHFVSVGRQKVRVRPLPGRP